MGQKGSIVRKAIYLLLLLIAVFVICTIYAFNQAKQMAADICKKATPGMPLEDILSAVSEKDYKIIRSSEYTIIVPVKGMGRNHCTITHDGHIIRTAKHGFTD
jgi:hypothetical protein